MKPRTIPIPTLRSPTTSAAVLLALLLPWLGLIAQESNESPDSKKAKFALSLVAIGTSIQPGDYFIKVEDEYLTFSAEENRNTPYAYDGPPFIQFFASTTLPDGTVSYEPAFTANLLNDTRNQLLIFEQIGKKVTVHTINESEQALPGGSLHVFNFCKSEIGIACDNKVLRLQPGTSDTMRFSTNQKRVQLQVGLEVKRGSGNWQSAAARKLRITPESRIVAIAYRAPVSPGEKDFQLVLLRDTSPQPATNRFFPFDPQEQQTAESQEGVTES